MKTTNLGLLDKTMMFNAFAIEETPTGQKRRKIPVKLAYAIRVIRKEIERALEPYEEERQEQVKEYSKKIKGVPQTEIVNGQEIAVFKNKAAEIKFSKVLQSLLGEKVEIEVHMVTMATIEKLGEIEEDILAGLEFLIEEFQEEEVKPSVNGQAKEKVAA